jgi:hypothetical protein
MLLPREENEERERERERESRTKHFLLTGTNGETEDGIVEKTTKILAQ